MALNHYLTLGRSGLRVSPLCLGTMTFGEDWGWGTSVADCQKIMDVFMDRGGNFIDTANMYTKGHSEKIIGDHIGKHPSKRDRAVIATKFVGNMYHGDPNGGGANRKAMMQQVEHSLRRLQTDYIDLYWMHCWDDFTPIDETLRGLDDLVSSGKVRYIGVSDTPAWKIAQAQTIAELRGWTPFVGLQIEYSLLERSVEGDLIPMAQELGLGVTPWGPLKSGVLSGKYTRDNDAKSDRGEWATAHLNDKTYDLIDQLIGFAKQLETTPATVALSWVNHRPGVTSTIIGARTLAQLESNLGAAELTLPDEVVKALDEATAPTLPFPHNFLNAVTGFYGAGSNINGRQTGVMDFAPKSDDDRY